MKLEKIMWGSFFVFLISFATFLTFHQLFPKAQSLLTPTEKLEETTNLKKQIHYVAVGDSLTEGVGDETKQGGFVPIVAKDIKERYKLDEMTVDNYGVSGDRSDQILKRLKEEQDIKESLETADIVTLTVGGNDLMKVIQTKFFSLSINSFTKPMADFQEHLADIFTEIRSYNQTAPIYVLGIYNPFYLNFSEIKDMQTIIDNWNDGTSSFVESQTNAYFIPINELLYQGLVDDEIGLTQNTSEAQTDSSDKISNNVLSDSDQFHPNNLGYQLMANAVRDTLIRTQDQWLVKDE